MDQIPNSNVTIQKIFCDRCTAATSEKTPGDVSTMNGIGRKFYGSTEPCSDCGSVTRTLWWTFIDFPVLPLGSYRFKTSEESVMHASFWCRKLPGIHWSQVIMTWLIGIAVVMAIITVILLTPR